MLVAIAWLAPTLSAEALSLEQAQASCKDGLGHEIVHACMQGLMGNGAGREANLAKCRAESSPKVHACVQAALNKANGRANVAVTIDDGKTKEVVDLSRALPAGFIPPPRTITDITAVLDREKPDPKTLAEMKATADAEPARSESGSANFYFARANARLTLGRGGEALADANMALRWRRAIQSSRLGCVSSSAL